MATAGVVVGTIRGGKPPRRISVLCAAATLAVAIAGIAGAASTGRYRGPVVGGGSLHLKAVVSGGEITAVKGLGWRRVSIRCQQGRFRFRGGFGGESFPVDRSRFRARGAAGSAYVSHARVAGSFRQHGRRAAGTLRVRGDLDAHHTNCRSGRRHWRARRRS